METSKNIFRGSFDKSVSQSSGSISPEHISNIEKYKNMVEISDDEKKIEADEATGSGSSGAFSAPLFSGEEPKISKKIEASEATSSGSVGAYETTAAWAKSSKKKDWRGASKPQYKGGKFVSVKKKCTKFPYCNSGDINALDIFENDRVKEAISNVSKKMGISENVIKAIIDYEYTLLKK